ncbi:hypothetical protein BR93DRAFT_202846 [Coniochaeta sp. PMI_546]|nr:hypothetical protein BR93DRAFT_202846 [Coniochaeta sp. PMI_546]
MAADEDSQRVTAGKGGRGPKSISCNGCRGSLKLMRSPAPRARRTWKVTRKCTAPVHCIASRTSPTLPTWRDWNLGHSHCVAGQDGKPCASSGRTSMARFDKHAPPQDTHRPSESPPRPCEQPGCYRYLCRQVMDLPQHYRPVRGKQGRLPTGLCRILGVAMAAFKAVQDLLAHQQSRDGSPRCQPPAPLDQATGRRVPSDSNESQKSAKSNSSAETEVVSVFSHVRHFRCTRRKVSAWTEGRWTTREGSCPSRVLLVRRLSPLYVTFVGQK